MASPVASAKGAPPSSVGSMPKEQVVHDGIADEHDFQNVAEVNLRLRRHLARQRVQGLADNGGHFLLAAGIHHHVRHPAHQIFAEADLRVHQAG